MAVGSRQAVDGEGSDEPLDHGPSPRLALVPLTVARSDRFGDTDTVDGGPCGVHTPRPRHLSANVAVRMAVLVVLLAGCAVPASFSSSGPRLSYGSASEAPSREDGWRKVPIDGVVRSIQGIDSAEPPPHLLAAGATGERPLLVDVTDGVPEEIVADLPNRYRAGLDSVTSNCDAIAVT